MRRREDVQQDPNSRRTLRSNAPGKNLENTSENEHVDGSCYVRGSKSYRLQLGQKLLLNCPKLELLRHVGEPSGSAEVGTLWQKLNPKWSPCYNVAAMSDRNGPFGRFRADLNVFISYHSPLHFFIVFDTFDARGRL